MALGGACESRRVFFMLNGFGFVAARRAAGLFLFFVACARVYACARFRSLCYGI